MAFSPARGTSETLAAAGEAVPPDGGTCSSASLQCGAQPGPFLSHTVPLLHATRAQCRGCVAVAGDLEEGRGGKRAGTDPEFLMELVNVIVLLDIYACIAMESIYTQNK